MRSVHGLMFFLLTMSVLLLTTCAAPTDHPDHRSRTSYGPSRINDHPSHKPDHRSQTSNGPIIINNHPSQKPDHLSRIPDGPTRINDHRSQTSDGPTRINDHRSQTLVDDSGAAVAFNDDQSFRSNLCQFFCTKDPPEGGNFCNCDRHPLG